MSTDENTEQPNQASASVSVPDNNGYPLFHCTKAVRAFKIGGLSTDGQSSTITIHPQDTSLPKYEAHPKWVEKHNPQAGGYVVFYADGYVSYSPAKAFEEGYQPHNGQQYNGEACGYSAHDIADAHRDSFAAGKESAS